MSIYEELAKLADLADKGVLTEEEFGREKARLLASDSGEPVDAASNDNHAKSSTDYDKPPQAGPAVVRFGEPVATLRHRDRRSARSYLLVLGALLTATGLVLGIGYRTDVCGAPFSPSELSDMLSDAGYADCDDMLEIAGLAVGLIVAGVVAFVGAART